MKKVNRPGQQFLSAVEAACENAALPPGMPPLTEIITELARHGYGKTDAESVYDYWLSVGFKAGRVPVQDWRASVRNMIRYNRLPSQKNDPPGLVEHKKKKPAQLREARKDRLEHAATEEERRRISQGLKAWRTNQ